MNPERAWSSIVRQATRETTAFQRITWLFAALAATVLKPGEQQARQALDALFWRGYAEGLAGLRGDDVGSLLGVSAPRRTPRPTRVDEHDTGGTTAGVWAGAGAGSPV